jgi:hypothetical protein
MSNESKAQELISVFLCEKDTDIEYFLKNRAILFEKLGKSRTFFIYDEDADEFNILAYFTLAIQVLRIPEEMISGRKSMRMENFYKCLRFSKRMKLLNLQRYKSAAIV